MGYYLRKIRESFLKGDLVLLLICVVMNIFGLLMIASTTNHMGNTRYLVVQGIASLLGILMFVLIMASVMASYQNRISSVRSVITMAVHLGLLAGLNMVLSRDLGVTLIFVFIFIGMAFTGGVSSIWFLAAGGGMTGQGLFQGHRTQTSGALYAQHTD